MNLETLSSGMNCKVCYKHCYHKKPCAGCLNSDKGKPEHCRKCKIKDCSKDKGISEIFRVLKKDGRLIIGDPLLEGWMSNRILGLLMQVLDGGVFTDKKRRYVCTFLPAGKEELVPPNFTKLLC